MKEIFLFLHFIGLSMGLGTSFAFMFLSMGMAKMEESEQIKFMRQGMAISKMGNIGLVLLVISGLGLLIGRWDLVLSNHWFLTKLVLVLVLGALIGMNGSLLKKWVNGDAAAGKRLERMGPLTMLVALLIVGIAVAVFK